MESFPAKILRFINTDELIKKYEDQSTSFMYAFSRYTVNRNTARELGMIDASEYYELQIKSFALTYEDPYEDIIMNEISLKSDIIKSNPSVAHPIFEWGLVNYKRFALLKLLGITDFRKYNQFGIFRVYFAPPPEVIHVLEELDVLDHSSIISSFIVGSLLDDDFELLNWMLNVRFSSERTGLLCGIFDSEVNVDTFISDLYKTFMDRHKFRCVSCINEPISVLFANFTLTLHEFVMNHFKNKFIDAPNIQSFSFVKPLLVNIYKATIRRVQKYNRLVNEKQIRCNMKGFINLMFILGDTTYCTSNVLGYLITLDHVYLTHHTLTNNYRKLFTMIYELKQYEFMDLYDRTSHLDDHCLGNIFDSLVKTNKLNEVLPDFKLSSISSMYSVSNLKSAFIREIGVINFASVMNYMNTNHISIINVNEILSLVRLNDLAARFDDHFKIHRSCNGLEVDYC